MTQGWVASTLPLTREEFVEGKHIRHFHYCMAVEAPRPRHRSICGQVTTTGHFRVLSSWPSGRVCPRCAKLYSEKMGEGEC